MSAIVRSLRAPIPSVGSSSSILRALDNPINSIESTFVSSTAPTNHQCLHCKHEPSTRRFTSASEKAFVKYPSCHGVANTGVGVQKFQKCYFSSTDPEREGLWGKVKGAFSDRMEKRKVDRTREQFERIGKLDTFTLGAFLNEYNENLSDWATKIPGLGNSTEKKRLQQIQKLLQTIADEVGKDATVKDLSEMDRKQKLSICLKGEVTIDSINVALAQFKATEMMHRVIKYRQERGQDLQFDQASLKSAMQETAPFVMTDEEKKAMRQSMMKQQAKSLRGRPKQR